MTKLTHLLFKFLWNGTDKVTRVSVINDCEKGGLKMIDLESMVKSLRLEDIFTSFIKACRR